MKTVCSLLLLLAAFTSGLPTNGQIASIRRINESKSEASKFALNGWTDYSVGTVEEITFPGCSTAPCSVSAGQQINMAIRFRPRDYHCCLDHRGILMQESSLSELSDGPLPMDPIEAGQLYEVSYTFTVNAPFRGLSEFRFSLHQNYVHELHIVIPVNIN